MRRTRLAAVIMCVFAAALSSTVAAAEPAKTVKVTVLSTMLAGDRGRGIGEWGFAALIEVDGRRILLDTGERPDTVLRNASELGIDLSDVTDLVSTHNHGDHTAGLVTLRRELAKKKGSCRCERLTKLWAVSSSSTRVHRSSCQPSGSPGPCRARTLSATGALRTSPNRRRPR